MFWISRPAIGRARYVVHVLMISGLKGGVAGRVLVGEGVLTKACRKKVKPRQFFLFNDLLVYGSIIISKKKYNTQHIIPLEEVKLKSLEDDGQFKNGWLICTRGKSFAVYAATATEKQEWMAHINKVSEHLTFIFSLLPITLENNYVVSCSCYYIEILELTAV